MRRYIIQAKRKNTNEPWSEWNTQQNYRKAQEHEAHVREVGYEGRIVPSIEVKKLQYLVGDKEWELIDSILDEGFALRDIAVRNALIDVKRQIHNKAVYPDSAEINPYISLNVVDAILKKFMPVVDGNEQIS